MDQRIINRLFTNRLFKLIDKSIVKTQKWKGLWTAWIYFPDDPQDGDFQNMFHNLFRSKINVKEGNDESLPGSDLSCYEEYLHNTATAFESG